MAIAAPPTVSPPREDDAGFTPFVPASQDPAELTIRALLLGAMLGVVFAASSVYLALKIGLTVSASIPIAVLAVAFFRTLGRSTILENNIVQTTGSAGESIAAGVVFTLPAILLMGYDLSIAKVGIIAAVGGILGILLMIPLRRALIVKEHKTLTYPEGTACAEVLIAGEKGGLQAKLLFQAFGLAFVYKFLMAGPQDVEGGRHPELRVLQRRHGVGRGVARTAGRGLHHRAAHRRVPLRWRHASPTSCSCRRSSSSARGWPSRSFPPPCSSRT